VRLAIVRYVLKDGIQLEADTDAFLPRDRL